MKRVAPLAVWGLTLLASAALPRPARGDVVYLKDGTRLEGEILRKTDAGWVVKGLDGKVSNISADRVKSFEAKRNGPGTGGDEPMQRLVSLRRSVETQTDINKVLERYRKFIEQHIGTPAADEALKDVEVWEQRLEKQMVKLGDKWVTKQEQGVLQTKALERAAAARLLLLQGRMKDAVAAIDAALAENPTNAAALYLRGVALSRQDQSANARKAFEASAQISPNHGPTLNNIAVIMWAAKQLPGALNYYGQAMNAAPVDRRILDNVAEALNELPEVQRDNAVTRKVVLLFNAQDMALQGRMKKRGLFRWGSTWVDEQELKDLKAQEERIEEKLEKLEDEFEQVQDRIEQIDRDVGDTERSIRRIEASSYGRDATGRATRLSYPRLYYDLKRDLEQMHAERDGEKEKAARLRKKAKQVKQELSVPRYTGAQQIIGVDGTPDLPPLSEAELDGAAKEHPATAPAKAQVGANDR
jgi:tetratricopeptide (TPR) repeat protein